MSTEAPTFDELISRVSDIAPLIAAENGLAVPGEKIKLRVIAEHVECAPVIPVP